jgi:hypothetical protein
VGSGGLWLRNWGSDGRDFLSRLPVGATTRTAPTRTDRVRFLHHRVTSNHLLDATVTPYAPKRSSSAVSAAGVPGERRHRESPKPAPYEIDARVPSRDMHIDRCGHRLFDIPAQPDASTDGAFKHASFSAPVSKYLGPAADFDLMDVPTVSDLFEFCGPTTVARLVVAVVVDTIYGMYGAWLRPHVRCEVLESKWAEPAFADRDSSTAVIGPVFDVGVAATCKHCMVGVSEWGPDEGAAPGRRIRRCALRELP